VAQPSDRLTTGLTGLVRERIGLLLALRLAGLPLTVTLAAVGGLVAVLPVLTAVLLGRVVAGLNPETSGIPLAAVVVLAGSIFALPAVESLRDLLSVAAARRIDGSVRARVRAVVTNLRDYADLETPSFQDDLLRASDAGRGLGRSRSPGTAATGQLRVAYRFGTALGAAVLLAAVSPLLAAGLLILSVVVRSRIRGQWLALVAIKDADASQRRRLAYLSDQLTTGAAKEVRIYGWRRWLTRRRTALAYRTAAPTWRALWAVLRQQTTTAALVVAAGILALGLPGLLVLNGNLSAAELVTAVYLGLAVLAIGSLGDETLDIEYGLGATRALGRLEARGRPATAVPNGRAPAPGAPGITFEGVGFRYPGRDRPALYDLSCTLAAGETVALVGANGAGKSTMIKLLAGLYRPTTGSIVLSDTRQGLTLDEGESAAWRCRVATVPQDVLRYPGTLRDNVTLAVHEEVTDEEVAEALHLAGAGALLDRLPDGLHSSLWHEGTGGTDLSGGMWQRIALARAVLAVRRGRGLILLDEPTAHLDVRAEADFLPRLITATPSATRVIVSHRLSTVQSADRIVLLHDGRLVEMGAHRDLMARKGRYAEMFELQAARFRRAAAR
jgi:ATP-binding cassette, subfamily B, bacterial